MSSSAPNAASDAASDPAPDAGSGALPGAAESRPTAPGLGSAILRGATLILVITLLARIAGFVRYLVFGASVGAGDVGTAYASANLVPNLLFEVAAGGALAASVVPLVAGLVGGSRTEREEASRIISVLLCWTLLVTIVLAGALALAADPLAALILDSRAPTDAATVALGARMLRVFALQLPLYGMTVVLAAYLQARKRFFWPALVPLLSSLLVILAYRLYAGAAPAVATSTTIGPLAEGLLVWGTTAGVAVMAISLCIPAARAGLRLRPGLRMPAGHGRRALALAGAGLGAVGAQQLALALILLLAMRTGGTGTLPVFQYAQAVYLLPFAVLAIPLITSVFPHLSEQRTVGDIAAFGRTAGLSLRTLAVIGAIGGAALFGAGPALEAFFRHIDRAGAVGVGAAVAAMALGLLPYILTVQCTRILSAALRARDAAIVGSIGWIAAGALIVAVAMASTGAGAAQAATEFAFAISIGMWVSAISGMHRVSDVLASGAQRAPLHRSVLAAAVAVPAGGIPALLLGRALVHQGVGEIGTVLLGVLTGGVAAAIALAVMALADPGAAARLRSRLPRGRGRR